MRSKKKARAYEGECLLGVAVVVTPAAHRPALRLPLPKKQSPLGGWVRTRSLA